MTRLIGFGGDMRLFTTGYEQATQADLIAALPCYEREAKECHRALLIAAVAPGADIIDLYP
jgi:hypothetical protein